MITKIDKVNKFAANFDPTTGFYVRTGIIENGEDTGVDPFMTVFPELLDIGIMGSCRNAHLCNVGCYQGAKSEGQHMSLEDYEGIINQSEGKVFQVALGGAGDPDAHPDFINILAYTRKANIVPNYTTSGISVTRDIAKATKKYCGSVAVSWYRQPHTLRAIELFLNQGCKTSIHYVLGRDSIDEAMELLKTDGFPEGINAVIFLTYKPVGKGTLDNVLEASDPRLKEFVSLCESKHPFKIGFDSCAVPMLVNLSTKINFDSIDYCESGAFSMYISNNMYATVCSFDTDLKYGVNLQKCSIEEAWNSDKFNSFRDKIKQGCPSCDKRSLCMGGCVLLPDIVLCGRSDRSGYQ